MKDSLNKDKDKQLYDVGSMGVLAGGYAGIMLFFNSLNITELILGILGISLGVLLILQWQEAYSHREKYIRDLKYFLIPMYAVFIREVIFFPFSSDMTPYSTYLDIISFFLFKMSLCKVASSCF